MIHLLSLPAEFQRQLNRSMDVQTLVWLPDF